jgi:hypothetical protein
MPISSSATFIAGPIRSKLAFHGALQQHVHRQQAVDLVGALVDPVDAAIAISALHGAFRTKAHAAVDLDSLIGHVIQALAGHHFQDRSFHGKFLRAF